MCVFPYEMGNFYKTFLFNYSLLEIKGKILLKIGPEDDGRLRGLWFLCQEVNMNENQICSKWSVIKSETPIR